MVGSVSGRGHVRAAAAAARRAGGDCPTTSSSSSTTSTSSTTRLPRPGRVPRREPAAAGPPGDHHPRRSRTAAGPAAGLRTARRDPRRRPRLHARRDLASCWRSQDVQLSERRPRPARGAHRGLAGRALPRRRCRWPAGPTRTTFVRQFSGGNRFIGDYLTEEVLSRHADEVREFIVTMSILDRFSAPLCDFVADTHRVGRRSCTSSNAPTCSWSRSTRSAAGSASTTCSPPWRAASSRSTRPTGCRVLHARAARVVPRPRPHRRGRAALAGRRQHERRGRARPGQLAGLRRRRPGAPPWLGWLDALGRRSVAADPAAGSRRRGWRRCPATRRP